MKSRTSFSKLTTFKKNITRFAPIWALYLIGLVLVFVREMHYYDSSHLASNIPSFIEAFGVVNIIYAGVCGMALFGDLYSTRMCYSLHALPQRRETWLLSHLASGLVFSLIPNLVATLLMMAQLGEFAGLALYWLLGSQLQFLFFFGVAAVSAMLAGNRFAMLLIYAGLNFVSILAYWIVNTIYLPMLYGVVLDAKPYYLLCPVVQIFQFDYMEFARHEIATSMDFYDIYYEFTGLDTGWGYLAILGVLGLALMGASALLYRMRHLESAGDFVVFSKLKGVMCVVMTICVGGVFAFIGEEMLGDGLMLWLIVGLVVGYFGSLMLLERRLKVFRKKTLAGFAGLAAVLTASFLAMFFDVFGIVGWMPEADQVKSVTISNYYSTNFYYGNRISVTLEKPEEIEDILEAHEDILDRKDEDFNNGHRVVITYKLESGRTVKRSYIAPASGKNYKIVSRYFYTPENILGFTDWESWVESVQMAHVDGSEIPETYRKEFLEALLEDCKAGQVFTSGSAKEVEFYIYLETENSNGSYTYRELAVAKGAENVIAILKTPEVILGYEDWDAFLGTLSDMYVSGIEVKPAHYAGLMEAVLADCKAGNVTLFGDKTSVHYLEFYSGREHHYLPIPYSATETIAYLEAHILN